MYADVDLVKDNYTYIEVKFAVKQGPTKLVLRWESDTMPLQVINSTYLYNRLNSQTTPFLFTVNPDITNSTMSTLINNDYQIAQVNIQEVQTLYARDKFGNKQIHTNDVLEVIITF